MTTNYNIQYNIPRVQVQLPGRQNRLTDGDFRVSPSMTEPVRFLFGNQDGVPLNLVPFKLHFVVWGISHAETEELSSGLSEVLLNIEIPVDNPYSGEAMLLLTEEHTTLIGNHAAGNRLSWSLFMKNEEGQIFPCQVSNLGGRYGNILVDLAGGMPIAELIRTPTG